MFDILMMVLFFLQVQIGKTWNFQGESWGSNVAFNEGLERTFCFELLEKGTECASYESNVLVLEKIVSQGKAIIDHVL